MHTILGKRRAVSIDSRFDGDQTVKKLKVPSYESIFGKQISAHTGFMWKSLKYIKEKDILLTTGMEGSIMLWDGAHNFQYLRTIRAFPEMVIYAVEYIHKLNQIACSSNNFSPIRFFDIDTGEKVSEVCKDRTFFNFLDMTYIQKMDVLVGGGFDRSLIFFDIFTKKIQHSIDLGNSIGVIKYLEKNNLLIVGIWEGRIKVIDLKTKKVVSSRKGHGKGYIMCLEAIEEKNIVISCGDDGKINEWKLNYKKELLLVKRIGVSVANLHPIRNLCSINNRYIFFVFDDNLIVFDVYSGKEKTINRVFRGSGDAMLYLKKEKGSDILFIANKKQGVVCIRNLQDYFASPKSLEEQIFDKKALNSL